MKNLIETIGTNLILDTESSTELVYITDSEFGIENEQDTESLAKDLQDNGIDGSLIVTGEIDDDNYYLSIRIGCVEHCITDCDMLADYY